MGPFEAVGSFSHGQQWALTWLSVAFCVGPYVVYGHFMQWAHVGFTDVHGKFARGFYRPLREICASLCDAVP